MKSQRIVFVGPVSVALQCLLTIVPATGHAQDCSSDLPEDEVSGGIVCPDGSAATVVPNDPDLVSTAPAPTMDANSAAPPATPYNDDMTATLEVESEVGSGASFTVAWTGPANYRDYVAVAAPGDPGNRPMNYAYVENGSPLQLTAPDAPGDYEVRYVASRSNNVLASTPITVRPVLASLLHESEVNSGSRFAVTWSGPANYRDYVAIAAADDPAERQNNYAYVEEGSPLQLTAPDKPGAYEIRYIQSQSRTVLAREPITVLPVTATIQAASVVNAGNPIEITWSGPANYRDYLAIAVADDPAERQINYAYVEQGSPLQLTAPDNPGDYELRYIQSQSRTVLARWSIKVRD